MKNHQKSDPDKKYKHTLSINGINKIFSLISKNSYKENTIISLIPNIFLQISKIENDPLNKFFTLCDCYNNYEYFLIPYANPLQCIPDHILIIKKLSAYFNYKLDYFIITIHECEYEGFALYQIFPNTKKINNKLYSRIFRYHLYDNIDPLQYNTISQINSLNCNLILYVRVIFKTTITSFKKNEKDKFHTGNLFYFDVIDINDETLRIKAIKNDASFYYKKINVNDVLEIKGKFQKNNLTNVDNIKNNLIYTSKDFKSPNFEIILGTDSEINELKDDNILKKVDIEKYIKYNTIYEILNSNPTHSELYNTICYILEVKSVFKVTYPLRKIKVIDSSDYIIDINIWNQFTLLPLKEGDYLIIKNIQVKKYKEVNLLTTVDETTIDINVENKEIEKLRMFIKKKNNQFGLIDFSHPKCYIEQILNLKNNFIREGQKKYFMSLIVNIKNIVNDKLYFEVCTNKKCQKKVIKKENNFWFCELCKKYYIYPSFNFHDWIVTICDISGEIDIKINSDKINDLNLDIVKILNKNKKDVINLIGYDKKYIIQTKGEKNENKVLLIESIKPYKITKEKIYKLLNTIEIELNLK